MSRFLKLFLFIVVSIGIYKGLGSLFSPKKSTEAVTQKSATKSDDVSVKSAAIKKANPEPINETKSDEQSLSEDSLFDPNNRHGKDVHGKGAIPPQSALPKIENEDYKKLFVDLGNLEPTDHAGLAMVYEEVEDLIKKSPKEFLRIVKKVTGSVNAGTLTKAFFLVDAAFKYDASVFEVANSVLNLDPSVGEPADHHHGTNSGSILKISTLTNLYEQSNYDRLARDQQDTLIKKAAQLAEQEADLAIVRDSLIFLKNKGGYSLEQLNHIARNRDEGELQIISDILEG